jgi:hypothetical protein
MGRFLQCAATTTILVTMMIATVTGGIAAPLSTGAADSTNGPTDVPTSTSGNDDKATTEIPTSTSGNDDKANTTVVPTTTAKSVWLLLI